MNIHTYLDYILEYYRTLFKAITYIEDVKIVIFDLIIISLN